MKFQAALALVLVAAHLAVPDIQAATSIGLTGAPWSHGPMCADPAGTNGVPTGQCRHMRILLRIDVPDELAGATNLPVTSTVNVANALGDMADYPRFANGQLMGFELDFGALILIEVTSDLQPSRKDTAGAAIPEPMLAFPGDLDSPQPYDPRTNPVVTLQWVLRGQSQDTRFYFLYVDSLHHGAKTPVTYDRSQLGAVAGAVGPGRGNAHYISLHGDLGLPISSDPRSLRITNLQQDPVTIDVIEYERFNVPKEAPRSTLRDRPVPGGIGQTITIPIPSDAKDGLKVVAKGGLVAVEQSSRVTATTFQPSTSRVFLPSSDGGYVGTGFAGQSPIAMTWLVFCPAVPANTGPCQVTGSSGSAPLAATIPVGAYAALTASANQATKLQAGQGVVLVERTPAASPNADQLGLTLWPPADGPISASLFMGLANSDQAGIQDKLMIVTGTSGSRLDVRSLSGARTILSTNFDPKGPGLYTDPAGGAWGTSWLRDWRIESNPSARPLHEDGPVRITDTKAKGMEITNGVTRNDPDFSAYVPALSPDGGLTYHATIPADGNGNPLGKIALFSPFAGTQVTARRTGGGPPITVDGLDKDEYVPRFIDQAGTWTINANHPVLVAWVKIGRDPMSGFALGVTNGITAQATAAQFAGYAFQVEAELFQTVIPTGTASFKVEVENRARKTDGTAIPDNVQLEPEAPSGWPQAHAAPSVLTLAAGETGKAAVEATVPGLSEAELAKGGATLLLSLASAGEPAFEVDVPLRINYDIARGVDLTANGQDAPAEIQIAANEAASFLVRLTNTGAVPDVFKVEFAAPRSPWIVATECLGPDDCFVDGEHITPELGPGETVEYGFDFQLATAEPARLTTAVSATSQADPSKTDIVNLKAALNSERDLSVIVDDSSRLVLPGGVANFTITLQNRGGDEEIRLNLSSTGPGTWPTATILVDDPTFKAPVPLAALNSTFGIRSQESVRLLVQQQVPTGIPPGQVKVLKIRVTAGNGDDVAEPQLRTVSGRTSGLTATGIPTTLTVPGGSSATLPIHLTSLSNGAQTITVRASLQPGSTYWNVTSGDKTGPWTVKLSPGGTADLTLSVSAAPDSSATSIAPQTLAIQLTAAGATPIVANVTLVLPDHLDLKVLETKAVLEAGSTQDIVLHVRNAGNLPANVTAKIPSLAWTMNWETVKAYPGHDQTLRGRVQVPVGAQGSTVQLHLVDPISGRLFATGPLQLEVKLPGLDIEVAATTDLGNGLSAFTLNITNQAGTPARMVELQLMAGDQVIDTALIEGILPGASATASLLSPIQAGLLLHVRTADDPVGRTVPLAAPGREEAARPWHDVPFATAPLLLAALASLALLRRRAQ